MSSFPLNFAVFAFVVIPYQSWLMIVASEDNQNSRERKNGADGEDSDGSIDSNVIKQSYVNHKQRLKCYHWQAVEPLQVAWLIAKFNQWFYHHHTILVRGDDEPEYFAASSDSPAKIVFAHGFFASSLHEISHWCVAGRKRRLLDDFGYWYAPDGRSEAQQRAFEQVEIVPQAIECLLTLACGRRFGVSQDNLFADFDTSASTFAQDVCTQAISFWQTGEKLPTDAKVLLQRLQVLRPYPITVADIAHNFVSS